MQHAAYAGRFGISQSMIKDWEKMSPARWKKVWVDRAEREVDEDHFDFGSLTDCLLFTPERFEDIFIIAGADIQIPSEQIRKIIDQVHDLHHNVEKVKEQSGIIVFGNPELSDYENELFEISKHPDIQYGKGKYTKERVFKEIKEKGQAYFDLLCETSDKKIISFEDNLKALELVDALKENPISRPYFVAQQGEQLFFQLELFVPYTKLPNNSFFKNAGIEEETLFKKGALDIVRVNHILRTVQVADFKTGYDASKQSFVHAIRKYKYGTQLSYYDVLLAGWRDQHFPGYKLLPPVNIAIDTYLKKPQIYRYRDEALQLIRFGGMNSKGQIIKGWEETLAEITWHIANNIWDNSREMVEQGFIEVDIF